MLYKNIFIIRYYTPLGLIKNARKSNPSLKDKLLFLKKFNKLDYYSFFSS